MSRSEDESWRRGIEANPAYQHLIAKYGLDYESVARDERLRQLVLDMHEVLLGRDNTDDPAEVERPIVDADRKRRDLFDFLAQGGSWPKAHEQLGLSVNTQARLLFNGYPSPVFAWQDETLLDFEQDVRAGMGEWKLARRYRLPPSQARKLIAVFRGMV